MQFKAILFDLDGTLLDSVAIILKSNEEVLGTMNLPYDETSVRNLIGIPLLVQARQFAGDLAYDYIDRYREAYIHHHEKEARLFPGTVEMLESLRSQGYMLALVTSKNVRGTKRVVEQMGLSGMFDVVITADDVTNPKPSPEPVIEALKVLRVAPDQALYVGDSIYDVDTARGADVKMVGVSWGARSKNELAAAGIEVIFDNWQQFLDWIGPM